MNDAAARPVLRVGLLTPGTTLAAWQRTAIERLVDGGDVEIATVVVDASTRAAATAVSRLRSISSSQALWRLYNNRWVSRRSKAVRRVDCTDLLAGSDRLDVVPHTVGRFSQHFPGDSLQALRDAELDVLLRFGFGILRGDVLTAAKYGIWSFHHDDERVIRGGPPSFWEVADELPTTGVLFQRLTDRLDAGVPLARATFRTVDYSYPRNRDRAAFGAAGLPARVARAVRHGWLDPATLPAADSGAPIRRNPTNRQLLAFAARQALRAVGSRTDSILWADRWGIGLRTKDEISDLDDGPVEWLPERRAGYYADPFPTRRDGVNALLVEDFDERAGRGTISAFRRDGRSWTLIEDVIDPACHASYPFVVETGGELYCVPEAARSGRLDAWRCERFPDRWTREHTLLRVPVVDPTIVEWNDCWWLFGTRRDRDPNAELWLWSSPELLGPWTPHPLNPVKIDVTSARPAGTPFVRDGSLHRPAQDCSETYGGAVVVNRVTRLDEEGFSETVVDRRVGKHDLYQSGTHTLSVGGGLVAIDAKRRVIDVHHARRELVARLRRRR